MHRNMTKLSAFPRLFLFAMNTDESRSLPCRKVRMMLLEVSVALFQKYSCMYCMLKMPSDNICFITWSCSVKDLGCSYNNVMCLYMEWTSCWGYSDNYFLLSILYFQWQWWSSIGSYFNSKCKYICAEHSFMDMTYELIMVGEESTTKKNQTM